MLRADCLTMSDDRRGYLLRTAGDIRDFEERMGDDLPGKLDRCRAWLAEFPVMMWFDPCRGIYDEDIAKEVIQTICYLYIKKRVGISFDERMRCRVEPEDYDAWVKENFSMKHTFKKSSDYL